jgi:hypothetical protein
MIVSTLSLLPLLLHLVVFDSEAAVPAVIQKSPPGGNCPNNDLGTGCLAPNAAPKACPRNASSFGPEFYAFVRAQFGTAVANMLARSELGPCGSFGGSGRKSPTEKPTK